LRVRVCGCGCVGAGVWVRVGVEYVVLCVLERVAISVYWLCR